MLPFTPLGGRVAFWKFFLFLACGAAETCVAAAACGGTKIREDCICYDTLIVSAITRSFHFLDKQINLTVLLHRTQQSYQTSNATKLSSAEAPAVQTKTLHTLPTIQTLTGMAGRECTSHFKTNHSRTLPVQREKKKPCHNSLQVRAYIPCLPSVSRLYSMHACCCSKANTQPPPKRSLTDQILATFIPGVVRRQELRQTQSIQK